MVILGMLLLTAAVVVALGTVLGNLGSDHLLDDDFAILGYHVDGTAGELFGYGVLTGMMAALGLYLVIVGALRGAQQRAATRRALEQARQQQESLQQQRDRLAARLDHERGDTRAVKERPATPTPARASSPPARASSPVARGSAPEAVTEEQRPDAKAAPHAGQTAGSSKPRD
jgi:hypothetical protein